MVYHSLLHHSIIFLHFLFLFVYIVFFFLLLFVKCTFYHSILYYSDGLRVAPRRQGGEGLRGRFLFFSFVNFSFIFVYFFCIISLLCSYFLFRFCSFYPFIHHSVFQFSFVYISCASLTSITPGPIELIESV